jgi:hypothetical protein
LALARGEVFLGRAVDLGVARVEWVVDEEPYGFDPAVDSPE